jgi:hypothetical protein
MGVRRGIAALLLITQGGCTALQLVDAPQAYVEARSPSLVLVTRNNGGQELVEAPRVLSDTMFGFSRTGAEVVIPFSDVRELRAKQIHPLRTALFASGLAAVTIGLSLLVIGHGPNTEEDPPEDVVVPVLRIPVRF